MYATCDISTAKTYVLGQYLDGQERTWHSHEELEMLFWAELEPEIRCIPIDNVLSPIAVYRDYEFKDMKNMELVSTLYYGIIHPRTTWASIFLSRAMTDVVVTT